MFAIFFYWFLVSEIIRKAQLYLNKLEVYPNPWKYNCLIMTVYSVVIKYHHIFT